MSVQVNYNRTLKIRINSELLDHVKSEADKLNIDVSTYVRWCIRTGLYLKDLNIFEYSKSGENRME